MNNKVRYSLMALAYFVIVVGVLIGTFFALKPVRDRNVSKEILKRYSAVAKDLVTLEEDEFVGTVVQEKFIGYDKNKNKVATLYTAKTTNQYGDITVIVAVAPDGKIMGIKATSVNQTLSQSETERAINSIKNLNDEYDGVSGVTHSNNTVKEILSAIRQNEGSVEPEPQEPELGVNFVSYKTEGQNLVGAIYQVTTDSINIDGSSSVARLSFKITVGLDNTIKGYEEVWYKHTGGNFKTQALEFFNSLIGKKLDEVNISLLDGVTGATNSKKAIIGLIDELEAYLEEHPFTLATRVKDLGNSKYNITKLSYYFNNFDELSFDVTLNENNELVSYEVITYRHTEGTFKQDALDFFDTLIGKDINTVLAENSDIDGKVGATNSGKAILNMLNDLSLFIEGDE